MPTYRQPRAWTSASCEKATKAALQAMASPRPTDAEAITDAQWIAHRYDRVSDRIMLRWTPREAHRQAAFLTDDALGEPDRAPITIARPLPASAAPPAPLHFIFHSAFCNSTLLTRALDAQGIAMGLSEPVILNDIVGIRRRKEADPQQLGATMNDALHLLARPWGEGEAVVVKPSNIVNPIAVPMLSIRPDAQALLLYAPLPLFLNSVARKGLWCRLWARELVEGLLRDGVIQPLGLTPEELFRQSDLQIAAVGWLAQQRLFAALIERFGPSRVRSLESEQLMAEPARVLAALGAHFQLNITAAQAASLAQADAFTRHSKSGDVFSATARAETQAATAAAHGEEIDHVLNWAKVLADQMGVPFDLGASLLD